MSLNWVIIGSDNGLSPVRRQAITWTNAGLLLIGPLGTNFSEVLIGIQTFSFKKMHLKTSSVKWRQFCLGLNVLKPTPADMGSDSHWVSSIPIMFDMPQIVAMSKRACQGGLKGTDGAADKSFSLRPIFPLISASWPVQIRGNTTLDCYTVYNCCKVDRDIRDMAFYWLVYWQCDWLV